MALDIHIAKTKKEATTVLPVLFFSEIMHKQLFHRARLSATKYPLLFRMIDYYSDTKYDINEIETLRMEVQKIKLEFEENKPIKEKLDSFLSSCTQAQNENSAIWVYCD